jgi:hypothetical protein
MGECECAGINALARFHLFLAGFLPIQHRRHIGKQLNNRRLFRKLAIAETNFIKSSVVVQIREGTQHLHVQYYLRPNKVHREYTAAPDSSCKASTSEIQDANDHAKNHRFLGSPNTDTGKTRPRQ